MRLYRVVLAFVLLAAALTVESPAFAQPADQPFHELRIIDSVDAPLLSVVSH